MIKSDILSYLRNPYGIGEERVREARLAAADLLEAPIDMILHCPQCHLQHIDRADWHNDPHSGAATSANEQNSHVAGDGAAQQSADAAVPVLLREGSLASSGHARHSVQDMPLPSAPIHGEDEDLHEMRDPKTRGGILHRRQDGQPPAALQDMPRGRHANVARSESEDGRYGREASISGSARETQIRPNARAVSDAFECSGADVQHLREDGASEAAQRGFKSGSLPRDEMDTRGSLLAMQHDAGLRERRSEGSSERDSVSRKTPVTPPIHRSHLCHGCGFIWRPADVATNGVANIRTHGSKDSRRFDVD